MQNSFPHSLPRTMGHSVFVVYFLLACAEIEKIVPVTHKWLLAHMQHQTSVNTVTKALDWLCDPEQQYAVRVTGGWRLNTQKAFQMPLTYLVNENLSGRDSENKNLSGRDSCDVVVVDDSYRKNLPTITTTTTTTGSENLSVRDSGITAQNLAAFKDLDIHGKKAKEISSLEWVTPDYIRAHVNDARSKPFFDNPEGFAIRRMEQEVPAPIDPGPQRTLAERKAEKENEATRRYSESSFSEYINREYNDDHDEDCECVDCQQAHRERFCQFQVIHKGQYLGPHSPTQHDWTSTCSTLLQPGQTFCDKHKEQ